MKIVSGNSMETFTFTIDMFADIIPMVEKGMNMPQNPKYHPEGNVFNHSIQCVNWALRETIDTDLILAALLHDVGKSYVDIDSFERGRHPQIGASLTRDFTSARTNYLIEHHMRVWSWILGEMRKLKKVQEVASDGMLPDLMALGRFDKMARNPNIVHTWFDWEKFVDKLNKKALERWNL